MPNSENCTAAPAFLLIPTYLPVGFICCLISKNIKRSGAVVQYLETLVLQRSYCTGTIGAVPAQWCSQYVDC
jgi:hypothetical protein